MLIPHHFPIQLDVMDLHQIVDGRLIFKRNKAETFASIGLSIYHNSSIYDLAVLAKELLQRLVGCSPRQPSDEDLLSAMML